MKNFRHFLAILLMTFFVLAAGGICRAETFKIVDAWIASEADEQTTTAKDQDIFPSGTAKVYCVVRWENAAEPVNITVRWHYETFKFRILDSIFATPVPQGRGTVSLDMQQGKTFPSGTYRCEIMIYNELVKEIKFQVL